MNKVFGGEKSVGGKNEENEMAAANKIRFYNDQESLDIAFGRAKVYEAFKKGLEILGVPYRDMSGRVVGTASRLHMEAAHIRCISRDGDWDLFVRFYGKMELSIEVKKGGQVFISYPQCLKEKPFLQQAIMAQLVQTWVSEEVIVETTPKNRK